MNDTTGLDLGIHQTHEEHARLHQLLAACRADLALGARLTATIAANLPLHLTELHEHLARHFAHEEHGGWLEEAVIRLPRLGTQLTALEKTACRAADAADGVDRQNESDRRRSDRLAERSARVRGLCKTVASPRSL